MRRIGSMRPSDHIAGNNYDNRNNHNDHNDHNNHNNHNDYSQGKASTKYSKLLAIDNMLANNICLKANLDNPVFPENITIDDNLYFSSGKSHEIAVLYDDSNSNLNAKLSLYAESFCFFPNNLLDDTNSVPAPFQINFDNNPDTNSPFPVNGLISNFNTHYSWYNSNPITEIQELYMRISEYGDISSTGTLFIAPIIDPEDTNLPYNCPYFKVNIDTSDSSDTSVVVSNIPFIVQSCVDDTTDSNLPITTNVIKIDPNTNEFNYEDGSFILKNAGNYGLITDLKALFESSVKIKNNFKVENDDTTTSYFNVIVEPDTNAGESPIVKTNNLPLQINGDYARLNTTVVTYPTKPEDLIRKIDIERFLQGLRPKGSADIVTDMSIWGADTSDTNNTSTITDIQSTGSLGSITFESPVDILTDPTQGVDLDVGSIVLLNKINCTNNFTGIYSWNVSLQPGDTSFDGDYTSISDCNADTNCDSNADTNMSPAVADITVTNGIVTSFVLTNTGEGYSAGDVATFILDTNDTNSVFEINVTQNVQAACGIYVVSAGVLDTTNNIWTYTWVRRDNLANGSNAVGATVFVTDGDFSNTSFIQINDQYQSGEGNPVVANTTTYVGQYQLEFDTQSSLLFTAGAGIDINGQVISVDIGQDDTNIYNNLIFSTDPITNSSYLTIRNDPIFSPSGTTAPITTSIVNTGIDLSGGDTDEPGPLINFNSFGDNGTAGQVTGLFFSRNDDEPSTIIQTYYNGDYSSDIQFYVTQKLQDTNDTNDSNWSSNPYLAMTIQPTNEADTAFVGINNSNPGHALDVIGNIRGTSVISISDLRLKENIKPLENSLDKILAMQGVSYNLINDEHKVSQVGVVAQEIEKVLPEVVVTDENDMKSVAYGNITAVLIEAVKELQQQVNDLKATVEELKK